MELCQYPFLVGIIAPKNIGAYTFYTSVVFKFNDCLEFVKVKKDIRDAGL
jgi:hypothetical protein